MSALSVSSPFPIFTDIDGQPLEAGYVWLGTVNLDPQVNPINVYWDAALTISAVQPIRTLGGYPANNGTPARVYVDSDYSIRVMNKNGSVVYSAPAATERIGDINASTVIYDPAGAGAVATTVQAKMRESVSVLDFIPVAEHEAIKNGTTTYDSGPAIQLAHDSRATRIIFPGGTYIVNTLVTFKNVMVSPFLGVYSQTWEGDDITAVYIVSGPNTTANMFFNARGDVGSFTFKNLRFIGAAGFSGFCFNCNIKAAISWFFDSCWASMGSSASGFFTGSLSNCNVSNCQFELQQICFNLVGNGNGQSVFSNNMVTFGYGSFIAGTGTEVKNAFIINGLSCATLYKGELIIVNNAQGWTISDVNYQDDLTFESSGTSLRTRGIVITNSNNIQINDCMVVVYPGTTQNHIGTAYSISNSQVQMTNCLSRGAIFGLEILGTGVTKLTAVNYIAEEGSVGIRFSTNSAGALHFSDCRLERQAAQSMTSQVVHSSDLFFNNCHMINSYWASGVAGIGIDPATTGLLEFRQCTFGRTSASSNQAYFFTASASGGYALLDGNTVVGAAVVATTLAGGKPLRRTWNSGGGFAGRYVNSAMPTAETWQLGDIVFNSAPTNAAGVVIGWVRVTSGSNNVLNTDWRAFGVTI